MANPLYEMYGQPQYQPQQQQVPQNNFMQQLQNFRSMINGDPQQLVQNLMMSGKMSQAQFQQYSQMANQILGRG